MSEPSVTLCLPHEGHPVAPSVLAAIRWCNQCACEVWAGEAAIDRLATEPGATLVCIPCGLGMMAATGGELTISPDTRRELARLGYSGAEIERMYQHALREITKERGTE